MSLPEGPCYEDVCALRLDTGDCTVSDQANMAVLTAVSALEMHFLPGGEESDARGPELQQLDNKLNVLIQMFAGFWRAQSELPPPVAVTVSLGGLRFDAGALEDAAQAPRSVALYLNDALPQPLVLPVEEVLATDDGRRELRFAPLSEDLSDALSRHIFRRHRRALAQNRQASNLHTEPE